MQFKPGSANFLGAAILIAVPMLVASINPGQAEAQEPARFEVKSDQGSFSVVMLWTPDGLERDHVFSFTFIDPATGSELEDIQYNFVIKDKDGQQTLRRVDQVATEQRARFSEVGPHTIELEDIEGLGENATFTIQVTPEFPLNVLAAAAAGAVAVFMVRCKSLFSQSKME